MFSVFCANIKATSSYLNKPLRTLDQAKRDRELARRDAKTSTQKEQSK